MKRGLVFIFLVQILVVAFSNCSGTGFKLSDAQTPTLVASTANGVASGAGDGPPTTGIGTGTGTGSGSSGTPTSTVSNTVAIQPGVYTNEPTVTVKICSPGSTTNCQTISNILVDTGSWGLRLFSSILNSTGTATSNLITLPLVSGSNGILSECVNYGDNSVQWGPVARADVYLAGETASSIPIQIINEYGTNSAYSAYTSVPIGSTGCLEQSSDDVNLDAQPLAPTATSAGSFEYNGILGVGLQSYDCGTDCSTTTGTFTNADYEYYYTCQGSSCALESTVPLANQVVNPVSQFASADNNGIVIQMAAVPTYGASSVTGSLIFGIGTQANNAVAGVTAIKTGLSAQTSDGTSFTDYLDFWSEVSGATSNGAFIDSGTNYYSLPLPMTTACTVPLLTAAGITSTQISDLEADDTNAATFESDIASNFCPSTPVTQTATFVSGDRSTTISSIPFMTESFATDLNNFLNQKYNYFSGIMDTPVSLADPNPEFDWGFPFFFGKSVYVGIQGKTVTGLGSGPFFGLKGVGTTN